jgi:hypothetical protein
VSADIHRDCTYLLVNDKVWGDMWGKDVSDLEDSPQQDTVYDADEPFSSDSYPFTITLPYGWQVNSHVEDYETDSYSYHLFKRLSAYEGSGSVDIAYITPNDSSLGLDAFADMMEQTIPTLYGDYDNTKREITSREKIISADGTDGIRLCGTESYIDSNGNALNCYTVNRDYYPDGNGGFYELRTFFFDDEEIPQDMKVLSSFSISS